MNTTRKALIILTPGFPANEADTTCLPAQQQFVKILREKNPDLRLIIITLRHPSVAKDYEWHNNQVISLNIRHGFYRRFAWLKIWIILMRIKRQYSISGLLCFWIGEHALAAFWFGRLHHLPHFCWIFGQDAKKSNHVVKLIHPAAGNLIAISDFIRDQFYVNHGLQPKHVIPIGVKENLFTGIKVDRTIDLIGTGSLVPLKEFVIFIETIKYLISFFPNLHAVICGKGPQENFLRSKIEEFHLGQNVKLAGEIPHGKVLRLMQQSKILLHPSSYEGFSSACLEALAAGAHVISFHSPMKKKIPHWHVVQTVKDMYQKTLALLQCRSLEPESAIPYTMQSAAKEVMRLFG